MGQVRAEMSAPLKSVEGTGDIAAAMALLGRQARAAARVLALAPAAQKDRALERMAAAIRAAQGQILAANADDIAEAKKVGATAAFFDRLTLTPARIESMAAGIETVRALPDAVGTVIDSWTRPN